eukprot:3810991-Pleurochrysis_carterae.AAC.2
MLALRLRVPSRHAHAAHVPSRESQGVSGRHAQPLTFRHAHLFGGTRSCPPADPPPILASPRALSRSLSHTHTRIHPPTLFLRLVLSVARARGLAP